MRYPCGALGCVVGWAVWALLAASGCGSAETARDVAARDVAAPDVAAPDVVAGDPNGGDSAPDADAARPPVPAELAGVCPLDADPTPAHWDQLAAWGVRVVRQGFYWEWLTAADGSLDFTWPDRYVAAAEARGIRVLVVLAYDVPWIHEEGAPRPSVPASAHGEWLAYVRAVAARYRDRAFGFEVWNEPNHRLFWRGSRAEFVALAAVTVPSLREVAPGVPVAVAGFSLLPTDWLADLAAAGVVGAADAVSLHPYWIDAEGALQQLTAARDWLAERRLERPLWLTEYGWPTGGRYPTAVDLDAQAERLLRFQAGAAAAGVQAAWWYASLDGKDPDAVEEPDDSEGFFGLAWPTAGDKPAARAFRVAAALLPGSRPTPASAAALPWPDGIERRAFRRPDGTTAVFATNRTAAAWDLDTPAGATVAWPPQDPAAAPPAGRVTVPADRTVVLLFPAGGE
jgi:hypothetical protein